MLDYGVGSRWEAWKERQEPNREGPCNLCQCVRNLSWKSPTGLNQEDDMARLPCYLRFLVTVWYTNVR